MYDITENLFMSYTSNGITGITIQNASRIHACKTSDILNRFVWFCKRKLEIVGRRVYNKKKLDETNLCTRERDKGKAREIISDTPLSWWTGYSLMNPRARILSHTFCPGSLGALHRCASGGESIDTTWSALTKTTIELVEELGVDGHILSFESNIAVRILCYRYKMKCSSYTTT